MNYTSIFEQSPQNPYWPPIDQTQTVSKKTTRKFSPTTPEIIANKRKRSTPISSCEKEKTDLQFEENFKKIELFIQINKEQLLAGSLGTPSKSQGENLLRLKSTLYPIPHNISYNKQNGEILINYGKIAMGKFKVVKKKWSFLFKEMVAVGKQFTKGLDFLSMMSIKEIEFLQRLKGKNNVIQLRSAYSYTSHKKGKVWVTVTKFCNMGKLENYLKCLTDKEKLQVASSTLRGLKEIHEAGIIHRDLKPDNIFLERNVNEKGEVTIEAQIGDFGLSCWDQKIYDKSKVVGSYLYMAPEIFIQKAIASFKIDNWAIGVVFSQLFEDSPFELLQTEEELRALLARIGNPALNPEPSDKGSIQYCLWKLLHVDLQQRMDTGETLAIFEKLSNNYV